MKKGPIGGSLKVLREDDIHRIHNASVHLLEEHGIECESDLILDIFINSNAEVDIRSKLIRLTPDMVESAIQSAPHSFVLYGRDPEMDLLLEPGRVYFGMGGTPEPFIFDYELKRPRSPTLVDMVNSTRVGQAAQNIDFVMSLCSAGDKPKKQTHLYEYDAIFRNTTKPVIYTSPGRWHTQKYFEIAAAAVGGETEFRNRPYVVYFTQPVSPMKVSHYSDGIVEAVEMGAPVMFSPGPMMGATSPATLAGTLVQVNAEALFGIVLTQLIKEEAPVIYAPHTGVMDMLTAQCTYGSPDQSLARSAVAQMAIFYKVPAFGLGGGAESKYPDAEAASQATVGMLLNALSGFTLTQTLGTLASGMYGSLEMLLICDEIAHMVKHVLKGINISDETLALEVIKEVGHGGHYLNHDHTARLFRQEFFFPELFRRQTISQWQDAGGKAIEEVAHAHVLKILGEAEAAPLPPGADKEMRHALDSAIVEIEKNPDLL